MTAAPVLRPSVPPDSASRHFDPVLRPDLAALYTARAARLRALAEGHELSAYLTFAAEIAAAQASVPEADGPAGSGPVDPRVVVAESDWPAVLDHLIAHLRPLVPAAVLPHLEALAAWPEAERRAAALALWEGRFAAVDPAAAPLLWAAFSTRVAQAVRRAPLPASGGQETALCPCCGGAPVASVIHTGDRQGLRYLHCALCDSQWHMVRAKCTSCGEAGALDYLSFDTPEAAVRAEACGACGGTLKVISAERDPEVEVVADDLATLALDDAAREEGFGRTGFNPFALPG